MKRFSTKLKAIMIIASVIAMVRPVAFAQTDSTKESKIAFTTNVDLYSRYLWRGAQAGSGPAIQPTLKLACGNFSFGAWGSLQQYGITDSISYPETDLFISYTFPKGFTLTINDYFISPNESALGDYFEYDPDKGSLHQIEGVLSWAGPEKFPLGVTLGYTFYGAEWDANALANLNGSFYGELTYPIKNLTLIAGGGNKYYTGKTDLAAVNIGAKIVQKVEITDKFTLPITGQIMINPNTKHIYYTVGFSF